MSMLSSQNILKENWKDIQGFEDSYQISDKGRVLSKERYIMNNGFYIRRTKERILKPWKDSRGYHQIYLCREGKKKAMSVHRLVMINFKGIDKERNTVNHKNGIQTDNRLDNLEWMTQQENNLHAWTLGLMRPMCGEDHPKAKLTMKKAEKIRELFKKDKKVNSVVALSSIYRVSEATIRQVINYVTWR